MRLADFCDLDEAKTAHLEDAHVAALRIYTMQAFKVFRTAAIMLGILTPSALDARRSRC